MLMILYEYFKYNIISSNITLQIRIIAYLYLVHFAIFNFLLNIGKQTYTLCTITCTANESNSTKKP